MPVKYNNRPVVIVTGASGGMGQACARLLGRSNRLVLTDVAADRLGAFTDTLIADGYDVAGGVAGDLADAGLLAKLIEAARAAGPLGALVHTAGLSPALADWRPILRTNLVATAMLVDVIEPLLAPGTVAVLIASIAGHFVRVPEVDAIADDALNPALLDKLSPVIEAPRGDNAAFGPAMTAYGISKRAVIRMAEARAPAWAKRGARIVTISPGIIFTPMGRAEDDKNPSASSVVDATPVGRWGAAMDIASAAEFLISDKAGFITGTDLRIDGGALPAMRGVMF